jgi:dienelactone hydrolase
MQHDGTSCSLTQFFDGDSGYACLQIDPPFQTEEVTIIFLHGVGERGGEIEQILKYGLPATLWSRSHETNCRVVCPHLPADQTWDAGQLARLVASVRRRSPKVVLCGYSLGGAGACALLARAMDPPDVAIVIAARFQEEASDSNLTARVIFIEGELDDWVDTRKFRESLARRMVPFAHVVMPGANHFIAEAAMEVEAVTSTFESVGICYRRCSHS